MSNKVVAGIFFKDSNSKDGKPDKKIETGLSKNELKHPRAKRLIREEMNRLGYHVEAISIVTGNKLIGFDVVVSVVDKRTLKELTKKKPVTRGGREIGEPIKARTMAHKRRAAQRRRNV